jgi:2-keto-4-pentenoate hydratase/2-oxohepta-3-ene-1,7-dioic acid hydratase in catechol pathway
MQLIRYQKGDEIHYGYLDGDAVGMITGDVFDHAARVRGPRVALLAEVKLLAPCQPSKIIGLVSNFVDRSREKGEAPPEMPLFFLKPPSTVIGPEAAIQLPPQSQRVEYGAELAVVIGKRARWVTLEEANQYILGYTCANDVTARDVWEQESGWARGKCFDTFCPLGPCIVTSLNPADLRVTSVVNEGTRQMNSTRDMVFSMAQLVAFLSSVMTLMPGDVLLTGTPSGTGILAAGDVVEVEIEGIGKLRNPVQAEER